MKYYSWNEDKNQKLKDERGISFEEVVQTLEDGSYLDIIKHPNQNKYGHQKMFIIAIDNYAYLVPFVEDEEKIFLKTIIPSREATKRYLAERK
jgi:uncharacterized DUF497 family protein